MFQQLNGQKFQNLTKNLIQKFSSRHPSPSNQNDECWYWIMSCVCKSLSDDINLPLPPSNYLKWNIQSTLIFWLLRALAIKDHLYLFQWKYSALMWHVLWLTVENTWTVLLLTTTSALEMTPSTLQVTFTPSPSSWISPDTWKDFPPKARLKLLSGFVWIVISNSTKEIPHKFLYICMLWDNKCARH